MIAARLRGGPLHPDAARGDLWRVAVEGYAARAPGTPVLVDNVAAACAARGLLPVLDHAGPATALWSEERPVGPAAVPESSTGRVPRTLDDLEWDDIELSYASAAMWCRVHGLRPIIAVDDDGLLHACVSPLMCVPPQVERVRSVVKRCAPCDVLCVVEDLAPQGLDPTAGIALCQQLVDDAEAETLFATAGTVRLAPLKERGKGDSVDVDASFLFSAAWLVGRVNVPIVAVGKTAADRGLIEKQARALGLSGYVVVED